MRLVYIIFIIIFITPNYALNSDLAARLRQEINTLEEQIRRSESEKRNAVEILQSIERKIELRRRLVRETGNQIEIASRRINDIERNLQKLEIEIASLSQDLALKEADLTKLRREIGQRATQAYRQLHSDKLLLLLTAQNPAGLARKKQYLSAIQRYDRRQIELLRQSQAYVSSLRQNREKILNNTMLEKRQHLIELEKLRRLREDYKNEETILQNEKRQKQMLISRIENDNALLRTLLEERRKSLAEIEREIDRLQNKRERAGAEPKWSPDKPFHQLTGKLPWPVESSRITQPFGPNRHPQLGTITINPGVDISTRPGDIVRSVATGKITRIAWLRGFGNTIIIDHSDGYYTVYARLESIFISEGDLVQAGQPIGAVGESGGDTDFHFEIWAKREKQNPLDWLRK